MKKLTLTAAALALVLAGPAFAAKTTIEYAPDNGEKRTVVYDATTNTATEVGGESTDYTWDEAGNTLCHTAAEGTLCVTFETQTAREVGATSRYTTNAGSAGTATITAIEP